MTENKFCDWMNCNADGNTPIVLREGMCRKHAAWQRAIDDFSMSFRSNSLEEDDAKIIIAKLKIAINQVTRP